MRNKEVQSGCNQDTYGYILYVSNLNGYFLVVDNKDSNNKDTYL